jgi:hypothetical protein
VYSFASDAAANEGAAHNNEENVFERAGLSELDPADYAYRR